MPLKPHEIFDALAAASPGDTLTWTGEWDPKGKKIEDVHGEAEAPITLRGASKDTASITGRGGSVFAARVEDCRHFRLGNATVRDFLAREQRGIQAFTSDWLEFFDLHFENGAFDFLHTAGCNHVVTRRCTGDGSTQQGRPGSQVGAHGVYHTRLESGGDVSDFLIEDCEFRKVQGSVFQLNGDGRTVRNATMRRIAGYDFGRGGGAGLNLTECQNVLIEDVTLHTGQKAGGIRAFGNYSGIFVTRFDISVVGFQPIEAQGREKIGLTQGTPDLPRLDTAGPPPPPPDTGGGGGEEDLAAAKARIAELEGIIAEASAVLARA